MKELRPFLNGCAAGSKGHTRAVAVSLWAVAVAMRVVEVTVWDAVWGVAAVAWDAMSRTMLYQGTGYKKVGCVLAT